MGAHCLADIIKWSQLSWPECLSCMCAYITLHITIHQPMWSQMGLWEDKLAVFFIAVTTNSTLGVYRLPVNVTSGKQWESWFTAALTESLGLCQPGKRSLITCSTHSECNALMTGIIFMFWHLYRSVTFLEMPQLISSRNLTVACGIASPVIDCIVKMDYNIS